MSSVPPRSPTTASAGTTRSLLLAAALLPSIGSGATSPAPATHATAAPKPASATSAAASPSPEVADLLETADDALEGRDPKAAIRIYRQADKLSPAGCILCQLGLAKAFNSLHASKDALKSVDKVLSLTSDRQLLRVAYNEQGIALQALAGDDKEAMRQAEAAFRRSLELGEWAMGYLNLGMSLLRQGRDPEGVAALEKFLELQPDSPYAERAKELIANPLRARKRLVPDLELVSLSGEYVTTEDLRGKVVLLDFWGTWCAPCRAAIPDLRSLNNRLKKSPFVLISISNDTDVEVLKRFVAEHRMDWLQIWDENHEVHNKLAVRQFPTYLLVDHEGEIAYVATGWGPVIEREIQQRIVKAVGRAKKSLAQPTP